ncbi:MAG: DivIVA domain-containing protein [Desulfobacterales bacterium]
MALTPLDIQQQQFKVSFRGFDIREVDLFLEEMADAFEALQRESSGQLEDRQRLKREIQGFQKREETFKHAMLNSQKTLEQMEENARKSGELTIAEAEVKAERILNKAHNRLAQLHEDIAELKRQRMQIEVQIRSTLEAHTKLLEMGQEEARKREEEDAKLKLFRPAQ